MRTSDWLKKCAITASKEFNLEIIVYTGNCKWNK